MFPLVPEVRGNMKTWLISTSLVLFLTFSSVAQAQLLPCQHCNHGCKIFTNPSGHFNSSSVSPGSSSVGTIGTGMVGYRHNSNCRWIIAPPGAAYVSLTFTEFKTELLYDQVSVFSCTDETCTTTTLLGTASGDYQSHPKREVGSGSGDGSGSAGSSNSDSTFVAPLTKPRLSFFSTTGFMKVAFTSDADVHKIGFRAEYTSCGSSNGVFSNAILACSMCPDPMVPNMNRTACVCSNPSQYVDTRSGLGQCMDCPSGQVADNVDGTKCVCPHGTYKNDQSCLAMSPTAGYRCDGRQCRALACNGCNGCGVITAKSGVLVDGGQGGSPLSSPPPFRRQEGPLTTPIGTTPYDSNYVTNAHCEWLIAPDSAGMVQLAFTAFDTEEGYDYVNVWACADRTCSVKSRLDKFSGTTQPGTFASPTGYMLVTFITDNSVVSSGFEATFTSCSGGNQYVSGGQCMTCPPNMVPNKDRTVCVPCPDHLRPGPNGVCLGRLGLDRNMYVTLDALQGIIGVKEAPSEDTSSTWLSLIQPAISPPTSRLSSTIKNATIVRSVSFLTGNANNMYSSYCMGLGVVNHICDGTLVKWPWVVTSAECAESFELHTDIAAKVQGNSQDSMGSMDFMYGQQFSIMRTIVHPSWAFSDVHKRVNIALVELSGYMYPEIPEMDMYDGAPIHDPVCDVQLSTAIPPCSPSAQAEYAQPEYAQLPLMNVDVLPVSQEDCMMAHAEVGSSMPVGALCAFQPKICPVYFEQAPVLGGGLIVTLGDSAPMLAGVQTGGSLCGESGGESEAPATYAPIAPVRDWIRGHFYGSSTTPIALSFLKFQLGPGANAVVWDGGDMSMPPIFNETGTGSCGANGLPPPVMAMSGAAVGRLTIPSCYGISCTTTEVQMHWNTFTTSMSFGPPGACPIGDVTWRDLRTLQLQGKMKSGGMGRSGGKGVWVCVRDWDDVARKMCGAGRSDWVCFEHDKNRSPPFTFFGFNKDVKLVTDEADEEAHEVTRRTALSGKFDDKYNILVTSGAILPFGAESTPAPTPAYSGYSGPGTTPGSGPGPGTTPGSGPGPGTTPGSFIP